MLAHRHRAIFRFLWLHVIYIIYGAAADGGSSKIGVVINLLLLPLGSKELIGTCFKWLRKNHFVNEERMARRRKTKFCRFFSVLPRVRGKKQLCKKNLSLEIWNSRISKKIVLARIAHKVLIYFMFIYKHLTGNLWNEWAYIFLLQRYCSFSFSCSKCHSATTQNIFFVLRMKNWINEFVSLAQWLNGKLCLISTWAVATDTSRIIRSNSAVPSASFWFRRAIFSENFLGVAAIIERCFSSKNL